MISEYWLLLLKKVEATPKWKAVLRFSVYYDQWVLTPTLKEVEATPKWKAVLRFSVYYDQWVLTPTLKES